MPLTLQVHRLGKASLAFSWIAYAPLVALQTFLWVWVYAHGKRRAEKSAYKSSIKGDYVEGEMGPRRSETVMEHINPAAPPITSALDRPATPVETAKPGQAQSI